MNKKGQTKLDYILIYVWAASIIVVVVGVLMFVVGPPQKPAEYWQEEWTCSDEKETGELINCREETKTQEEIIEEDYTCLILGEDWHQIGELCKPSDYDIVCRWVCRRTYTETTCEHETKCVEQKPRKCLITNPEPLCIGNNCPKEIRECDEAIE